jgi:hypothetical protein
MRSETMLVWAIPGREEMIVAVHATMVGDAGQYAKREYRAEVSNV